MIYIMVLFSTAMIEGIMNPLVRDIIKGLFLMICVGILVVYVYLDMSGLIVGGYPF